MDRMELMGLQVIASDAVERGTLHAIASPPKRSDYPTFEQYKRAYLKWERKGLWTVTNIEDDSGR